MEVKETGEEEHWNILDQYQRVALSILWPLQRVPPLWLQEWVKNRGWDDGSVIQKLRMGYLYILLTLRKIVLNNVM